MLYTAVETDKAVRLWWHFQGYCKSRTNVCPAGVASSNPGLTSTMEATLAVEHGLVSDIG